MSGFAPNVGVPFGRYRLLEQLGIGGMAVVHRAVTEGPGGFSRSVVVKRIRPELAQNPEFIEALVVEARVSALLHHPSIVQVQDFGQVGGEHFLVMEYVDGVPLGTVIRRSIDLKRPLPVGAMLYLAAEIAGALGYAHELRDAEGRQAQIVHRDVTPSNIMVTRSGSVKLLDFGIAKAAQHVRETQETRAGDIKGKLGYLSPEQAEGQRIDHRTDLFALGVVLYEGLSQRRLFHGTHDFETLKLVREANVAPLSSVRAEVGPEVDAVLLKLLARDPSTRYQSGGELASALRPLVHKWEGDAEGLRRFVEGMGQFRPNMAPATPHSGRRSHSGRVPLYSSGTLRVAAGELENMEEIDLGARARSNTRLIRTLALVLGMGAAVVVAVMRMPASEPLAASAAAPLVAAARPAPPPAPEPPATPVRLRVPGPKGAQVLVDGVALGTAPLELSLPRTNGTRIVMLRRKHGSPVVHIIPASEDFALTNK